MVKRKNRGRSKGRSPGREKLVQCDLCGAQVPDDKAIKTTDKSPPVNRKLAYTLRKQGAYVPTKREVKYYCVSCAIKIGIIHQRSKSERKGQPGRKSAEAVLRDLEG
ncbi:MAG: 30S ribosomal protein S26e [Candidatus Korarchaeota archaeon]|nr:30S ribosomal protein S26e [Candidatus Korarchaeota archaeon]NIU83816.1 30S ribosomal protein S26e [Candidatus Thorarchaeota archaeon]NIW15230.1 30S ribosomal protein S26e [Candidatus Thorarchaeota archaeon]NIW53207.1 30S ribosomal protein S26e [Candidatus Korarchaeota archaeon]